MNPVNHDPSGQRDGAVSAPDQPTVLDSDPLMIDAGPGLSPGQRMGPYRIERQLGEGGMGTVYLAEQLEPIQRRVALKLIRGQLQGGLAEAYFMVERQALARMDHPAIAKVYDAGTTPDGFPFFAMEWIDGLTLSVYLAANSLSLEKKLELFARICRGVHHAHQKGVIHRDLKPTNVLVAKVDGQPAPKIIDFGVAIGVADSGGPAFAQSAGTHRYMSPEQALGQLREIDIRTDVFALGVMLLELLAPSAFAQRVIGADLDNSDLHTALLTSLGSATTAGDERIDALARDVAGIPAELRWILVTALQRERTQRYASAEALGNDIERYLNRYPVRAVPPTATYRLRKFASRNRLALVAAGLVAVALIAGAGAAIYGMLQARDAAARATVEANKARETSRFLTTLLSGVSPEIARDLDKTLLHRILDRAAERAQKELAAQPQVLAEVEGAIGATYNSLAEPKLAIQHTEHAYALSKQELGATALPTLLIEHELAREMFYAGKLKEACELHTKNFLALQKASGDEDKHTLDSSVDVAQCDAELGNFAAADQRLVALLPVITRVEGPDSDLLLSAMTVRASVLDYMGRYAEAEAVFKEVVARNTEKYGAEDPKTLDVLNNFAILYLESHRYADGAAILQKMLPICEKIYGPEHGFTLNIVSNLGGALRQQGTPEKIAESGPYYKRALDGEIKKYGEKHPNTIRARHNYGNYLLDVGDVEGAISTQQRAVADAREKFGDKHPVTAELEFGLGKALVRGKRYADAEPVLLDAVAQKQTEFGDKHWRVDEYMVPLTDLYAAWGKADRLEEWKKRRAALDPKPANAG